MLFLLFLSTAAPSVGWLDGGELTAAAWELGVSHPPGQPLPTLLWRAAMLIPVGSIAFRATLLSALCVAGATFPLVWIAGRLGRGLAAPARSWLVPVSVLPALLGLAVWSQAVRAEVYALQLLLGLGVIAAAIRCGEVQRGAAPMSEQPRAVVVLVGLLGLSGATHPLLAAGLVPVAVLALAGVGRRSLRAGLLGGALAGAAALGSYLYLPLRSAARPGLAWGMPHTPARFLETLSGRAFAHNFSPSEGDILGHNAGVLSRLLLDDAGAAVVVLGIIGIALLWRHRQRWTLLLLVVAMAGNLATVAFQNKVFASNPDLHGYLALSTVLLALCGAQALLRGLDWLAHRGTAGRIVRLSGAGLVLALGLAAIPVGLAADRSRNHLPELWSRGQLDPCPPGAVVVLSGTSSSFVSWYLQRVEGRRPDLVVFRRLLLGHEFHEHHLRLRHGDPPAGVDTTALRGDAGVALVSGRPVLVEIREPDLRVAERLLPAGRLARMGSDPLDLPAALDDPGPWTSPGASPWALPVDGAVFLHDAEAVQLQLYGDLLRAAIYEQRGRPDLVEAQLAAVRRYAPEFEGPLPMPADEAWWRQR